MTSCASCSVPAPKVFCQIALWNGEPAGLRSGSIPILDVSWAGTASGSGSVCFARHAGPRHRQGAARQSRGAARARRVRSIEWAVLDWNTPSIEFYKAHGAEFADSGSGVSEVTGDALARLKLGLRRADRGGRGKWRDRRPQQHSLAPAVGFRAFQAHDHGQSR